jgi:hypothetical protein
MTDENPKAKPDGAGNAPPVIDVFTRPDPLPKEEADRIMREAVSGVRPQQIQAALQLQTVKQLTRIADALEALVAAKAAEASIQE